MSRLKKRNKKSHINKQIGVLSKETIKTPAKEIKPILKPIAEQIEDKKEREKRLNRERVKKHREKAKTEKTE